MLNHIRTMLQIKDENITFFDVTEKTIKRQLTTVVHASLSDEPRACPSCGCTKEGAHGRHQFVKNGKKITTIRMEPFNDIPLVLKLAKQRFHCRECEHHWTAQTSLVDPGCIISRHIRLKIMRLFVERISYTLIAKLCHVSIHTVIRELKKFKVYLPTKYSLLLPEVLMVDEFRSHAKTEDKMSFICADGKTGALIDILSSRKLEKLIPYFNECANTEDVKFLVSDMNAAYFQLIPKVFTNAKLIIDRFHIVKHLNEAFNDFRVKEVKRLRKLDQKSKLQANKIKSNWKKLLKNRENIDISEYKTWRSFRAPKYPYLTEAMMLDRLLSYSDPLKEAYEVFHTMNDAFRKKDGDLFFATIQSLPANLDDDFRKSIQNLLKYEEGIRNALRYSYSNGKLEAKNTHIKTLKRVSYGFKSYENMRTRIFLMNGLIKIK
ncbi:MAG TPA: ISL3 family transposase [Candidatus Enterococcus avicola]|uniref:ISL3 family transposase n=1 Tax=Candidatus Enterococcus avicola TaxID=2838561 RepID=A0A9D2F8M9_9ENTE|nr:ISL3 family transposase [Candidatus Enterococcus avicola]